MFATILARLGLSAASSGTWIFIAFLMAASATGAGYVTYRYVDNSWKAAYATALEKAAAERQAQQEKFTALERMLRKQNEDSKKREDALVQEMASHVDRDNCRVDDAGMQKVLDQIRSANRR